MRLTHHLVLIGPMGSGKTTVGERLADQLTVEFRDSDRDLATLFGTSGASIADQHGVATLHAIEAGLVIGSLAASEPMVIAVAASAVENPWCRAALARRATLVVLDLQPEDVLERMSPGDHRRSIDIDELVAQRARRHPQLIESGALMLDATEPVDDLLEAIVGLVS